MLNPRTGSGHSHPSKKERVRQEGSKRPRLHDGGIHALAWSVVIYDKMNLRHAPSEAPNAAHSKFPWAWRIKKQLQVVLGTLAAEELAR